MIVKKALFSILGVKTYLKLVSKAFFISLDCGLLRRKRAFDFHYFVKKLIRPGDTIIDIGANVGYYSKLFARYSGVGGSVISVEPVLLFRDILKCNTRKYKNIQIMPFALGEDDGKKIRMGIPAGSPHFRHGLTRVMEENTAADHSFTAEMRHPAKLFVKIRHCNYIKMDVEGYEVHIIPLMMDFIKQHKPLIQLETSGENLIQIRKELATAGYQPYSLFKSVLTPLDKAQKDEISDDLLFVPGEQMERLERFM